MQPQASRISRRAWLMAGLVCPLAAVELLLVRRDASGLRLSAPQLHFLTGKPLEQLKNGAGVSFLSQVTVTSESAATVLARRVDRFVVSYDLWEEKFSVVRLGPPRRSASGLTAQAAEAWCLDHAIEVPVSLPAKRPFWIRLEVRAEDSKESAAVVGEPGINITRLIEIFSRPPRSQQPRWVAAAGPLRLEELK